MQIRLARSNGKVLAVVDDGICYFYKIKRSGSIVKTITAISTYSGVEIIDSEKLFCAGVPTYGSIQSRMELIKNFEMDTFSFIDISKRDNFISWVSENTNNIPCLNLFYMCIFFLLGCRRKKGKRELTNDYLLKKIGNFFSKSFGLEKSKSIYYATD